MLIHRRQLPWPKDVFRQKLDDYIAAREAHKKTEGVPAPFPEHEVLRLIYEQGTGIEIVQEAVSGARYADPEQTKIQFSTDEEPGVVQIATAQNVYWWTLLSELPIGPYEPPAPPTAEQLDTEIKAQLAQNDLKAIRALIEGDTVRLDAYKAAQVDLRAQLSTAVVEEPILDTAQLAK